LTDITFVETGHHYDSYTDFFKLARLSGFPVIKIGDLDISQPGVFIGTPHNGEWEHIDRQTGRRNAHIVLWNIERPSGSEGAVGKYASANWKLIYKRQVDEVWVSDPRLADETQLRYVTLGSHRDLCVIGNAKHKKYNMTHMSYATPRRETIYNKFNSVGRSCWPPERTEVLKASRFALNVHQDSHPFQEPLRAAIFASAALPVLSETVYNSHPYGGETMQFADYHDLDSRLHRMIAEPYGPWAAMGLRMHKLMTEELEFGKVVRLAVEQKVGEWR